MKPLQTLLFDLVRGYTLELWDILQDGELPQARRDVVLDTLLSRATATAVSRGISAQAHMRAVGPYAVSGVALQLRQTFVFFAPSATTRPEDMAFHVQAGYELAFTPPDLNEEAYARYVAWKESGYVGVPLGAGAL